jgi:hypothetical protein
MKPKPFRRGDIVTINSPNREPRKGRVICDNRLNKYNLRIVVLVMTSRDTEIIECFLPDGRRWLTGDVSISHGWDHG